MPGERGGIPPTQVARLQGRESILLEGNFNLLRRLIAPEVRGVLWCMNLGELTLDLGQLARLRQALSESTCTITHLFIDPLSLPQRCVRSAEPNAPLQEAQ